MGAVSDVLQYPDVPFGQPAGYLSLEQQTPYSANRGLNRKNYPVLSVSSLPHPR